MLKGIAEDKPPEPMLLSIYGRDPRVANDWAQVTLKPAQDAIADFKSSDATNVQLLRIDVALRSEEHTSAPVTNVHLVCRILLAHKQINIKPPTNSTPLHTRQLLSTQS